MSPLLHAGAYRQALRNVQSASTFLNCWRPAEKQGNSRPRLVAHFPAAILLAWTLTPPAPLPPGVHFLCGDSLGNIAYWTQAALPLRSPLAPLGGKGAQYGTGSQYDWVDIIPHRFLPHVINPASGVIFSGNHLPVGSWYPLPLQIGQGGSGDSQRSWRLRELLTGQDTFSPEDMLGVHFDDVNAAIRVLLQAGYQVRKTGGSLSDGAEKLLDILQYWYSQGAHWSVVTM